MTWRWSRRNSDTATTSITLNPATTGTNSSAFLSQGGPLRDDRFVRRLRIVVSANTNVTYRCESHQQIG